MSASLPMPQNFDLIGTKNVFCLQLDNITYSDCHLKMLKSFFHRNFEVSLSTNSCNKRSWLVYIELNNFSLGKCPAFHSEFLIDPRVVMLWRGILIGKLKLLFSSKLRIGFLLKYFVLISHKWWECASDAWVHCVLLINHSKKFFFFKVLLCWNLVYVCNRILIPLPNYP